MQATANFFSRSARTGYRLAWLFLLGFGWSVSQADDAFETTVRPFLNQHCAKCHRAAGEELGDERGREDQARLEPKGGVDLSLLKSGRDLPAHAELIDQIIDVLESQDMPPESEPEVAEDQRTAMIAQLKATLATIDTGNPATRSRVRRLNRWQYNYTVKDLFRLNRNVFALPEKLMTRQAGYLRERGAGMPTEVRAVSEALRPRPGLQGVKAFPKDLRAAHGFDNQANQLTMSPLLLDAFLKLAVSIVESPDFNRETVGIWDEFFASPQGEDANADELRVVIGERLGKFLSLAFRRPIDEGIVQRYTEFVIRKIDAGVPFTAAMKNVASAVLSSPLFLYRVQTGEQEERLFELAENLSYLLWSSAPDERLLELAASGQLADPEVLRGAVDRMLADPRIERFLDAFPAQWLQLENVLAATPDPRLQRYFSLDKDHPASLQLLIEPLLLFDAVFLENRPLVDLIQPEFVYRSRFLDTWYESDLQPPAVDVQAIVAQNQANEKRRQQLSAEIREAQQQLTELTEPIRQSILAAHASSQRKPEPPGPDPVPIRPLAAWDFNGNLLAESGGLDLEPHGKIEFKDGKVVLKNAYLLSRPIPVELKAKTLEVWCAVQNLDMPGGGLMGIQGPGGMFDAIVIGERMPRHWISGSEFFRRTLDFGKSQPETLQDQQLHLVMVYDADGTTRLYRNGQAYGQPFKKERTPFPARQSRVIFGLRHLPPSPGKFLDVSIDRARLYDRALSAEEVGALHRGEQRLVSQQELEGAMTAQQRRQHQQWQQQLAQAQTALAQVPADRDPAQVVRENAAGYDEEIRRQLRDPVFRRMANPDPRYGGVITNAAIMSMTSGPQRSHPIARGAWIIEVVFNDPPPPPPNDVPPLNEDSGDPNLTIREKFRVHRENPDCAGCHARLDPLGFAMENFDLTGRWRDHYANGREVDMQGTLFRRYPFENVVEFKQAIVKEDERLAKAFTEHLLRYALERELVATDRFTVEKIVEQTTDSGHAIREILQAVILSETFSNAASQ